MTSSTRSSFHVTICVPGRVDKRGAWGQKKPPTELKHTSTNAFWKLKKRKKRSPVAESGKGCEEKEKKTSATVGYKSFSHLYWTSFTDRWKRVCSLKKTKTTRAQKRKVGGSVGWCGGGFAPKKGLTRKKKAIGGDEQLAGAEAAPPKCLESKAPQIRQPRHRLKH